MKKNIETAKERIINLAEKWYILEPLYFLIWSTHEFIINTAIQTIRTARGIIEYNPNFINSLSDDDLHEVIKIEIIRILLKHPYSRQREIPTMSYLASNITIAEYCDIKVPLPKASTIFGSDKYNLKHFEFYYYKLLEQSPVQNTGMEERKQTQNNDSLNQDPDTTVDEETQNEASAPSSKPTQDKKNDFETSSNEHTQGDDNDELTNDTALNNTSSPSSEMDAENQNELTVDSNLETYLDENKTGIENTREWNIDDLMQQLINDKIETAIQNNSWGTASYSLREMIVASLKPKVDYRAILKAFRASVLSQRRTLTRMKPSRRYEFQYMGSRREFCTKLLVAIDVSGSMDKNAIAQGYSVINHFFKYGIELVDVIQFDAAIQGEVMSLKKARQNIQITGRGGTDFQPVLDYIDQHQDYDGLIIFTDGYSYKPKRDKNRRTLILWLFNNEKNYNYQKKELAELGKCAFMRD